MVFQNFNLFPHLTALENVIEAPVAVRGASREPEATGEARDLLARVGLSDKAERLSAPAFGRPAAARRHRPRAGAQAQGAALRRADLGARPRAGGRSAGRHQGARPLRHDAVIVTHEIGFAREVADRVVFMEQRPHPRDRRARSGLQRAPNTRAPRIPRQGSLILLTPKDILPMIAATRFPRSCSVPASAAAVSSPAAYRAAGFDLSPEQPGRPRAEKNEEAIKLLGKDAKFAKDGVFTVAITSTRLPFGAYGTDTKTLVGSEPDIAQLVADSLGRKLEIVSVAWADWPLGVASGKYDAAMSNVTVTEQRKEKFDFSTYRKDLLGFYVKASNEIASRSRRTSPASRSSSAPAPTRSRSCCAGTSRTSRMG
jgi:hypothetical protein